MEGRGGMGGGVEARLRGGNFGGGMGVVVELRREKGGSVGVDETVGGGARGMEKGNELPSILGPQEWTRGAEDGVGLRGGVVTVSL